MIPKWIWSSDNSKKKDQYVYLRKEILTEKEVGNVKIKVSASDQYKLFINGELIGRGPCPSNPAYQYYDEYEITIKNNNFVIAAECYFIGQDTYIVTEQNQGIGGFWFELIGDGICVVSDESWQVNTENGYMKNYMNLGEARISNWSGFKEVFVSQNEPSGWKHVGYSGDKFLNATLIEEAEETYKTMLQREIPFLLEERAFPQKLVQVEPYLGEVLGAEELLNGGIMVVDASKPQSFPSVVFDFGKETVGYLNFELRGSAGASMSIWYGESLDMMRVDTLVLNGSRQEYSPYHRRAFRFIKLVFNNSEERIEVFSLHCHTVRYHYPNEGSFSCSNELLNKIFDTGVHTVKLATQNHFEDSVWREEMQWLADARVMSLVNYWVFGDKRISRKAIRQFFRNQLSDGKVPPTGPQPFKAIIIDFGLHLIMMCYEYYYYTLDKELLFEIRDNIDLLMEKMMSIEKEGLISIDIDNRFIPFIDWAVLDKRDRIASVNCFYYKALQDYSKILTITNDEEKAQEMAQRANVLKEKINDAFFSDERGLYMDCLTDNGLSSASSQQTNLIAVYCGIVDESKVGKLIAKTFEQKDIERVKGAFLLSFIIDMLFEKGFKEQAVEMMKDYWGEMIARGATTWWETFDRKTPKSSIPYLFSTNNATAYLEHIPCSHSHGWGAGPSFFMMKNIIGIKMQDAGFRAIKFEPYTEGLDYASGSIYTPMGHIHASWKKNKDGSITKNIVVPENMKVIE